MQNIGERLEEARKRRGISVREAAEATKLRSDFINHFENNQFNFNLPEVYKRGFLKIYARFLNLDTESIVTDYNAIQIKSEKSPMENQKSFGLMSLSQKESAASKTNEDESPDQGNETPAFPNKNLYIKVGLVIAGILVIILTTILLIKALSKKNNDTQFGSNSSRVSTPNATEQLPTVPTAKSEIFLIAKENVRVVVRRKADQQNIFNATIQKGQRIPIPKQNSQILQISFSDGANLIIQKDGKQILPETGGPGWIELK